MQLPLRATSWNKRRYGVSNRQVTKKRAARDADAPSAENTPCVLL